MHTFNLFIVVVVQLTFIYFLVDFIRTGYTGWKRMQNRKVINKLWKELGMPDQKSLLR